MAGFTCTSCGGKAKKNQQTCDACKTKLIEIKRKEKKTIVNEVLMYANFHRGTSTKESVIAALVGCCEVDALNDARDILYAEFGDLSLFEEYKKRVSSPNRTEKMAVSEDVITCLNVLEENGISVQYTAEDWEKLPKVHPAKLSDIALADQVAEMTEKFRMLENSIAEVKTNVTLQGEKMLRLENDQSSHAKVLQGVVDRGDVGVCNKSWPCLPSRPQTVSTPDGAVGSTIQSPDRVPSSVVLVLVKVLVMKM